LSEQEIMQGLIELIGELESEWERDLSKVGPDSYLMGDLGCDSQDFVMLRAAIETKYGRDDIPFENLIIRDGQFVPDIRLGDVVKLLKESLNSSEGGP